MKRWVFQNQLVAVFVLLCAAGVVGFLVNTAVKTPIQSAAFAKTQYTKEDLTLTVATVAEPVSFTIELAVTPDETAKGLMFRRTMNERHGMLFFFDQERIVTMWMKNTYLPLDMVFLDSQGRITHIHKGAVPHSLDIISSKVPARFVLEINAGEADQYGLAVGQQASHPWFRLSN